MLLDHDGYLPSYVYISNGKKHAVTITRKVPLSPYSIVTMDRGYNGYSLFTHWTENHIFFVTRLKDNTDYSVVEERDVPQNRNILADQLIQFSGQISGQTARKKCPHILRKVAVWDKEQNRQIILLTNHLEFGTTTISQIYKDCWQIELFFKWIKQHLRIKSFFGYSENAVKTQIWIAISIYVTVAIMKKRLGLDQSLYTIYRSSVLFFLKKFQFISRLMNRTTDLNLIVGISN